MASSLYEVLGIAANASHGEIKTAYRKLARTCHPDTVSFNQKETSENQFIKIHVAYSTLSDPDKRANYDKDFNRCHLSSVVTSSSRRAEESHRMPRFSGYTCKNWETDQCW